MSRTLPTRDELDRASAHAVDTMRDTCVLLTRTAAQDPATGMPIEGFADGAETVCGFAVKTRREGSGSTQVITTITVLRLPLAVPDVDTLSRVRLTVRRGRELPMAETYDITAAQRGTLQWNLELRRVAATREA